MDDAGRVRLDENLRRHVFAYRQQDYREDEPPAEWILQCSIVRDAANGAAERRMIGAFFNALLMS